MWAIPGVMPTQLQIGVTNIIVCDFFVANNGKEGNLRRKFLMIGNL